MLTNAAIDGLDATTKVVLARRRPSLRGFAGVMAACALISVPVHVLPAWGAPMPDEEARPLPGADPSRP